MQFATSKCFKEFRNKLFPQKFQAYFPYCKMALKQKKIWKEKGIQCITLIFLITIPYFNF